jgi:hypothetical protein
MSVSAGCNGRDALHDDATLSTSLGLESLEQSGHTVTIDISCRRKQCVFSGEEGPWESL